jgi:hypothetical protein
MFDAERQVIPRQNKRPLDRVLQLAYVPRPFRFFEIRQSLRRQILPRHFAFSR